MPPPDTTPPQKLSPSDEDSVYTLVCREESLVLQWRFDELIRMGVTGEDASRLADLRDVAHTVAKLIAAGCPAATAVRIVV